MAKQFKLDLAYISKIITMQEKLESIFEDSSMIPVFDQILIKLNKLNINSEISFKDLSKIKSVIGIKFIIFVE